MALHICNSTTIIPIFNPTVRTLRTTMARREQE
jgi:hypothetical protein